MHTSKSQYSLGYSLVLLIWRDNTFIVWSNTSVRVHSIKVSSYTMKFPWAQHNIACFDNLTYQKHQSSVKSNWILPTYTVYDISTTLIINCCMTNEPLPIAWTHAPLHIAWQQQHNQCCMTTWTTTAFELEVLISIIRSTCLIYAYC